MGKTRTLPGEEVKGVFAEEDTSDTPAAIVPSEITMDDLTYLAKKQGVDLNKVRQERLALEKQEKLKRAHDKHEQNERNRQAHEAALFKEFYQRQGKSVFIFINGKPLTVKEFEDVKCPTPGCSHKIGMEVKGRVFDLMNTNPYIPVSLLAPVHGIFAIYDKIHCDAPTQEKRHLCSLRIQQIDPTCEM